jgi:hypothetical protein
MRRPKPKPNLQVIIFDYFFGTLVGLFFMVAGPIMTVTGFSERKSAFFLLSLFTTFFGVYMFSFVFTALISDPSGHRELDLRERKLKDLKYYLWIALTILTIFLAVWDSHTGDITYWFNH